MNFYIEYLVAGYAESCIQIMDVRYTGVMIENYEDKTDGDDHEADGHHERFQYFGNMVLHQGGELGYHGYNHQPLCLGQI